MKDFSEDIHCSGSNSEEPKLLHDKPSFECEDMGNVDRVCKINKVER